MPAFPTRFRSRRTALLGTVLLVGAALLLAGCESNLFEQLDNFWTLGCCGSVVVILDILALIELAGSARALQGKIIWALIIIFAPLLGCILYYLFAR